MALGWCCDTVESAVMRGPRRWEILALAILLCTGVLIAAKPTTTTVSKKPAPTLQMDAEEINRIRQLLMDSNEQIQLRFEHDVLRRYASATSRPWEDFNQESHFQQAMEILHDSDTSYTRDVRVLSDPLVIAEFKARVLPMIVKGCGSNGCHGSVDVGGFYLSYRLGNAAEVYADYDVLRKYVKTVENNRSSMFAEPIKHYMIDTDQADKSLVVQYALPPAMAEMPHPQVKNWRPMVMDKSEMRYQELIRWIGELKE
jgi:hypothetical protein